MEPIRIDLGFCLGQGMTSVYTSVLEGMLRSQEYRVILHAISPRFCVFLSQIVSSLTL